MFLWSTREGLSNQDFTDDCGRGSTSLIMRGFWNVSGLTFWSTRQWSTTLACPGDIVTPTHPSSLWLRMKSGYELRDVEMSDCPSWHHPEDQVWRNLFSSLWFLMDLNLVMLLVFLLGDSLENIIKQDLPHLRSWVSLHLNHSPFSSGTKLSSSLMYHQVTVGQLAFPLCPKRPGLYT